MKKSMIEVAYGVLKENKEPMPFINLWKLVSAEMGYNQSQFEDNIAQFYTDLSIDSRYINLPGNVWDLRSRHKMSENVLDTDSIAVDEEEEEQEESMEVEEKEEPQEN
ncbi:MAG: DNA-directed RNA polymerase subunit delta [Holdemanella sp.]|nr:DNA-directed RNA polymerase subunit delta [Holdemanella sp.]